MIGGIELFIVAAHEFKRLFKSTKAIIIVLTIFAISYYVAKFFKTLGEQFQAGIGTDQYAIGVLFVIFILGPLFTCGLCHDTISRERATRTMRFLVTKTSRPTIIIGKYLGIWLFWLCCIAASYILVAVVARHFIWLGVADGVLFISVIIGFYLLFSVLMPNPGITMFFGIVFALLFPIVSFYSMFSSAPYIAWFKYVTPYYYSTLGYYYIFINLLYAAILLMLSILLFSGRDL